MTDPLGFNKVTCLTDSDTIVAVPFRPEGSVNTQLSGDPTVNGDYATLPLGGNLSLTAGELAGDYYAKFTSGAKNGAFYPVTANDTDSLTIDLNGDNLAGAATGDSLVIAKYWTLDALFPPDQATTAWTETPVGSGNWVPDGHAIVASESVFPSGRRTEILLPDTDGSGINLATTSSFYIYNDGWRQQGEPANDNFGSFQFQPDNYLVIRHPESVDHSTKLRTAGEVELQSTRIPLQTRVAGKQDNFIGLLRPVDVTLDELSLGGTAAFVSTVSPFPSGRRDQILLFDNSRQAQNKSPIVTYYFYNGAWRRQGQDISIDFGGDVISAGTGFMIRKYQTAGGETALWINTPNY